MSVDRGGPLLRSKLVPPPVPSALVVRPRLSVLLDSGAPVTLVSAPAGWGKSTMLASWLQSRHHGRVAWLSIDPGDDDSCLWSYVDACLRAERPRTCRHGRVDDLPPDEGRLAETLDGLTQPTTLVLDDFQHVRDARSLAAVEFLVRHSAGRLRVVLASRVEPALPLPRWRLSGDLLDIGTEDLAFTTLETTQLLDVHGHSLPDDMVAELHAYAEGWPAVLRLAALALGGAPHAVSVDAVLAAAAPTIRDYLRMEVLLDQPSATRDALLRTSILERLSGGLVQAMTGRADGESVLVELQRRNMFAASSGTQPPSPRYHRALGDMLHVELRQSAPDEVAHLHRRAAAWHESHELVGDALRHALAAGDFAHAASLATEHWHQFVLCQRAGPHRPFVAPPDDVVRADPGLALACAAAHVDAGDAAAAGHFLRLAEARSDRVGAEHRDGFVAGCAALELARARLTGDPDGVRSSAQRLLAVVGADRTGRPSSEDVGAVATTALGLDRLGRGDLPGASDTLADALVASERLGLSCAQALCASALAFIRAYRGELRASQRLTRAALAVPSRPGHCAQSHRTLAYAASAIVDIERNRFHDATANLRLAEDSCGPSCDPVLPSIISVVRAQLQHEGGDPARAYQTLLAGRRYLAARPAAFLRDWYAAVEAGVRAEHGDIEAVRRSLAPVIESSGGTPAALAVTLARVYLAADDHTSACSVLPRAPYDGDLPRTLRLEAGLVEVVAADRRGDHRGATRMLERLLEVAEPEGFRRVFLRAGAALRHLLLRHLDSGTAYWCTVKEIVDAIDDGAVVEPSSPGLVEALTEREVVVLRYLQSVLSNAEIASDLSVSVNTVKTHVRNIYRKLDATRRRDAVRRGRQLRLI